MPGIGHQLVRLARFGHQGREDAFENKSVPSHKAVVGRLVRAIGGRRVTSLQAVGNDVDDAADGPPFFNARQSA